VADVNDTDAMHALAVANEAVIAASQERHRIQREIDNLPKRAVLRRRQLGADLVAATAVWLTEVSIQERMFRRAYP